MPDMWICCQLGAREHYSIPRALHFNGELELLVTDAWAEHLLPWKLLPGSRAAERFHGRVDSSLVKSFDWSLLVFESCARRNSGGWTRTIARNRWFQERALRTLQNFCRRHQGSSFTLFSYSYAALRLFECARDAGWSTVLGQIDPGPFEEHIVLSLQRENAGRDLTAQAPEHYWRDWREECRLAHRIVVNSEWSRKGLRAEGIPEEKLCVVPLAYDLPSAANGWTRQYPTNFTSKRPLRVLFLGLVNLRKGVGEILSAIPMLEHLPVEFWMVGPVHMNIPAQFRSHPRVRWIGAVTRSAAANYYREADVFLFPTFSDGFGLTQLEAQAWDLPIVASRRCGDVVRHLENGYLLQEPCADEIVNAIKFVIDPGVLDDMAGMSRHRDFTFERLAARLQAIGSNVQGKAS